MSEEKRPFEEQENVGDQKVSARIEALATVDAYRIKNRLAAALIAVLLITLSCLAMVYFQDKLGLNLNQKVQKESFITGVLVSSVSVVFLILFQTMRNFLRVSVSSNKELIDQKHEKQSQERISTSFKFLGLQFSYSAPVATKNSFTQLEFDDLYKEDDVSWMTPLLQAKNKIIEENERLSFRSSGNLSAGIAISAFGGGFLIVLIFFPNLLPEIPNTTNVYASYAPRLTLFVFIQLLAAFFLKLYVSTEKTIERNQREISNIYLRLSAGFMAGTDEDAKQKIVNALITEERYKFQSKGKSETLPPDYLSSLQQMTKLIEKNK